MPGKRSARIDCTGGSFWVTPKIFWRWVREGVIEVLGERPLSGKYRGGTDTFQVSVNHVILDLACPEHLHEFVETTKRRKACS
jgi:hypothetical protein